MASQLPGDTQRTVRFQTLEHEAYQNRGRGRGRGRGSPWNGRQAKEKHVGQAYHQTEQNREQERQQDGRQRPGTEPQVTPVPRDPASVAVNKAQPKEPSQEPALEKQLFKAGYCGPITAALDAREVERALSLAVYLSYVPAGPDQMPERERKALQECHSRLVAECKMLPLSGNDGAVGLPLALALLNNNLLSPKDLQSIQDMRQQAFESEGLHLQFDKDIKTITEQAQARPLDAMAFVNALYLQYRSLFNCQQLEKLADCFRAVVPGVLEHCQALAVEKPRDAGGLLERNLFHCLELLPHAPSGDREQLRALQKQVSHSICHIFTENLMMISDGRLEIKTAGAHMQLIHYSHGLGVLSKRHASVLQKLVEQKKTPTQEIPGKAAQVKADLEALLQAGQCYEALRVCMEYANKDPVVWNGKRSSELFGCMKRALKGELACLCLQLGPQGLNPDMVDRINTLFNLMGEFRNSPWLIGRDSFCTLNYLRVLVVGKVLQPQWDRVKSQGYTAETVARLRGMLKDKERLLLPSHATEYQQFVQALEEEQKNSLPPVPPASQASKTVPRSQASDSSTHSSPVRERGQRKVIMKRPESTEASHHAEITEDDLRAFLESPDKADDFRRRMNEDREGNLEEGKRWMLFLREYYTHNRLPASKSKANLALSRLVTGAAFVVLHDLFQSIKALKNKDEKYVACGRVAVDMIKYIHPLQNVAYDYFKHDYQSLTGVVHFYYLMPLKNRIVDEVEKPRDKIDFDLLWQRFSDAYQVGAHYETATRKCLREIYTRYFSCDLTEVQRQLSSRNPAEIQRGLATIEARILDRKHFYSWHETEKAAHHACELVKQGKARLKELVGYNAGQWLDIQKNFLRKVEDAGFLQGPPHYLSKLSKPQSASSGYGDKRDRRGK
ncbi:hypothetical protein [Sansalvadorimonas verongulae]|uniref:hypothetical protein n=1 Tax=Sansalvadorimonas verongulae TaxID=2172824 RepID=UPI0012BB7265|nr:hypothetical protein [Sansalvadorimonas verongulae]MTI13892.1 hypothetical protein [Sansalvadorimonas verongulae]